MDEQLDRTLKDRRALERASNHIAEALNRLGELSDPGAAMATRAIVMIAWKAIATTHEKVSAEYLRAANTDNTGG